MSQPLDANSIPREKTTIQAPSIRCAEPANSFSYCCGQLGLLPLQHFLPSSWQEGPASFWVEFTPYESDRVCHRNQPNSKYNSFTNEAVLSFYFIFKGVGRWGNDLKMFLLPFGKAFTPHSLKQRSGENA